MIAPVSAVFYACGMTQCPADAPAYEADFYSDEFIRDPWPRYAEMRALGAVVWLPQLGNFALTRHAAVHAALQDHRRFSSAHGVAGDAFGCDFLQGNTVASDPPRHRALRRAMAPPLLPSAMAGIRDQVQALADGLIERLVEQEEFDAVADLARFLPLTLVRDLVGLPDFGQERMLAWAGAAFDVLGVQNERGCRAVQTIEEMRTFIGREMTPDTLKPGSWTRRIIDLAEQGNLDPELAPFALRDYINPSLDTTIAATGHLVWQLAQNPGAWQALRADPSLAENAVHEAVRLGSPIRSFTRQTVEAVEVEGVLIPAGQRVMMLYASANRDERAFPDPDRFDVTRTSRNHVGFGTGIHMCVGMHLAVLEITCLLHAMIPRVARIETGEGEIALNNTICAFARLPARFVSI